MKKRISLNWKKIGMIVLSILLASCNSPKASTKITTPTSSTSNIQTNTISPFPSVTPTATLIPYFGTVKIYGHVVDEQGNPLVTNIGVEAFGLGDQGFVASDSSGYYQIQVENAIQYLVSILPGPENQLGKYSFPTGLLSQRKLVLQNGPESQVDFTVHAGGTLWLQTYDLAGKEMTSADFIDTWKIGAYPLGMYPEGETLQNAYHGYNMFWGWIQGSDQTIPCLLLPPGEPAEIWVVWRLPVTGVTFLHADNGGQGFTVERGDLTPVNLVYEFARTEYRIAAQQFNELQAAGYTFSSDIPAWLRAAGESLARAENLHQSGAVSASAVQAYQTLTNVIMAREGFTLQKAKQDIETSRKGNLTLTLVDDHGKLLSNAKVEYQQVSHDFIFSTGFTSPENYPALKAAGFEYTYFQTWWGMIESSPGGYTFPDASVSQQEDAGLGYVYETGPTFSPIYYKIAPGFPVYASSETPADLSAHIRRFNNDLITHYLGRIKLFNAFVEPDLLQAFDFTPEELVDFAASSIRGAKQAQPDLQTYILVAHPVFGSILDSRTYYSTIYSPEGDLRMSFNPPITSGYEFAESLINSNAGLDMIGLEYYYGAPYPPIDMGIFSSSLDHFSTLSKKVFIGEIAYPSLDGLRGVGKPWEAYEGWHAGYTDQVQAEFARDTLTIAFSKPYVAGYQWGLTNDNGTDYYLLGSGLFHQDHLTPRPAFSAFHDLIASWTTSGEGTTDSSAALTFRGFGGDYQLKITTADGRTLYTRAHVTEQQNNQVKLTVDTTPPAFRSAAVSSQVVRNGDQIVITADLGEPGLAVTADLSQLDSTSKEPVKLALQPDGLYSGTALIHVINTFSNGHKTITYTAQDEGKNTTTKSIGVELRNPPPMLDEVPPDDNFSGSGLDMKKWSPGTSGGGNISQNDRLILSTSDQQVTSTATIYATWQFSGDFDVQVDFQIGPGWSNQEERKHVDGALFGVKVSGNCVNLARGQSGGQDLLVVWNCLGYEEGKIFSSVLSGTMRIQRIGTFLIYSVDQGAGWQELAVAESSSGPAQISIGIGSYDASQAFTTYFDNFKINSGLTNYLP